MEGRRFLKKGKSKNRGTVLHIFLKIYIYIESIRTGCEKINFK